MKLLLDTCISPRTRSALADSGHDVIWVGDWDTDPGDETILEAAERDSRILITLDKDFGELAVVLGRPHCGIVRLVDIDPREQARACEDVLARHGNELVAGAIATVARDRTRLRPADEAEKAAGSEPDQ